jgi:hypothetical protein
MIIAYSIILLALGVWFYRLVIGVPDAILAALHVPLWLVLGITGGVVAWMIADD